MIRNRCLILDAAFAVILLMGCWLAFDHVLGLKTRTLSLPTDPALVLRIDPAFKPAPPLTIPIELLTIADRHIFVDATEQSVIQRLVIVQYETVRSGADFKFLYAPKPPVQFGGTTYRFGAYVYDDQAAAQRAPAREAGMTRKLLQDLGFDVPRFFRVARLARVADSAGNSEVILFYMENADAAFPTGVLPGADQDGDLTLAPEAAQSMLARLKASVVASAQS